MKVQYPELGNEIIISAVSSPVEYIPDLQAGECWVMTNGHDRYTVTTKSYRKAYKANYPEKASLNECEIINHRDNCDNCKFKDNCSTLGGATATWCNKHERTDNNHF